MSGIKINSGVTLNSGITFSLGTGGVGGTGSITYTQMPGPVIPQQLQDSTAIINDPVGFTINNSQDTGVLLTALTQDNITYFNNLGPGAYTATLGTGSTYNTIAVNVVTIPSDGSFAQLVWFFDSAVAYPATFNYPFTIR